MFIKIMGTQSGMPDVSGLPLFNHGENYDNGSESISGSVQEIVSELSYEHDILNIGKVIFNKIEGVTAPEQTLYFFYKGEKYKVKFNPNISYKMINAQNSGKKSANKKTGGYKRKNMDFQIVRRIINYYIDNKDRIGFSNNSCIK